MWNPISKTVKNKRDNYLRTNEKANWVKCDNYLWTNENNKLKQLIVDISTKSGLFYFFFCSWHYNLEEWHAKWLRMSISWAPLISLLFFLFFFYSLTFSLFPFYDWESSSLLILFLHGFSPSQFWRASIPVYDSFKVSIISLFITDTLGFCIVLRSLFVPFWVSKLLTCPLFAYFIDFEIFDVFYEKYAK